MEFVQELTKGYSDKDDEEEEDEEIRNFSCKLQFSPHGSSSSPSSNYNNFLPDHHFQDHDFTRSCNTQIISPSEAINFQGELQLLDLALKIDNNQSGCDADSGGSNNGFIEREHMFDKVVTPSDVGKLNRLVIPKQHAEKYFPLDSSINEKGLILNFEDGHGKSWRFRYSYWNSSQSYVMTKGWSRFVKEKKLNAGDTVSFHCGVGELRKDRLFIDYRRRYDVPMPNPISLYPHLQIPNQSHFQPSVQWGSTRSQYPIIPPSGSVPPQRHHEHMQRMMDYSNIHPYYHHEHNNYRRGKVVDYNMMNFASGSQIYNLRPPPFPVVVGTSEVLEQGGDIVAPMVIESMPNVHHGKNITTSTVPKRLRLFGVNMECSVSDHHHQEPLDQDSNSRLLINGIPLPSMIPGTEFSRRVKANSMSFDWDNK